MDFLFDDPSETRLPPDEVRIRDLQVQLLEGGRKVKIYLEVDPFQKRPSAELTITDPHGKPVSSVSIIESMLRKMELTMHLRGEPASGQHTIEAVLFYGSMVETVEASQASRSIERRVVDTSSRNFEIPE
jgi:hypothetical protein